MNHVVLATSKKVVTTEHRLNLPAWMRYAVEGQKIQAIKALRDLGGRDTANGGFTVTGRRISAEPAAPFMSLKQAKNIVEDFTNGLVSVDVAVDPQ